jgi:hypothetical protein
MKPVHLSQAGPLVDAALSDLEPQKLVLFIQSFGIPVASMSKLLLKLDRIVQVNAACERPLLKRVFVTY